LASSENDWCGAVPSKTMNLSRAVAIALFDGHSLKQKVITGEGSSR
jgi:hypothetical protein